MPLQSPDSRPKKPSAVVPCSFVSCGSLVFRPSDVDAFCREAGASGEIRTLVFLKGHKAELADSEGVLWKFLNEVFRPEVKGAS